MSSDIWKKLEVELLLLFLYNIAEQYFSRALVTYDGLLFPRSIAGSRHAETLDQVQVFDVCVCVSDSVSTPSSTRWIPGKQPGRKLRTTAVKSASEEGKKEEDGEQEEGGEKKSWRIGCAQVEPGLTSS